VQLLGMTSGRSGSSTMGVLLDEQSQRATQDNMELHKELHEMERAIVDVHDAKVAKVMDILSKLQVMGINTGKIERVLHGGLDRLRQRPPDVTSPTHRGESPRTRSMQLRQALQQQQAWDAETCTRLNQVIQLLRELAAKTAGCGVYTVLREGGLPVREGLELSTKVLRTLPVGSTFTAVERVRNTVGVWRLHLASGGWTSEASSWSEDEKMVQLLPDRNVAAKVLPSAASPSKDVRNNGGLVPIDSAYVASALSAILGTFAPNGTDRPRSFTIEAPSDSPQSFNGHSPGKPLAPPPPALSSAQLSGSSPRHSSAETRTPSMLPSPQEHSRMSSPLHSPLHASSIHTSPPALLSPTLNRLGRTSDQAGGKGSLRFSSGPSAEIERAKARERQAQDQTELLQTMRSELQQQHEQQLVLQEEQQKRQEERLQQQMEQQRQHEEQLEELQLEMRQQKAGQHQEVQQLRKQQQEQVVRQQGELREQHEEMKQQYQLQQQQQQKQEQLQLQQQQQLLERDQLQQQQREQQREQELVQQQRLQLREQEIGQQREQRQREEQELGQHRQARQKLDEEFKLEQERMQQQIVTERQTLERIKLDQQLEQHKAEQRKLDQQRALEEQQQQQQQRIVTEQQKLEELKLEQRVEQQKMEHQLQDEEALEQRHLRQQRQELQQEQRKLEQLKLEQQLEQEIQQQEIIAEQAGALAIRESAMEKLEQLKIEQQRFEQRRQQQENGPSEGMLTPPGSLTPPLQHGEGGGNISTNPLLSARLHADLDKHARNGTTKNLHDLRPLVIAGPAGAGKATLIERLVSEYADYFGFSVSHTSRPPRPSEVGGVDYHFSDCEQMAQEISQGLFHEHATDARGVMYATSFRAIADVAAGGRVCVFRASHVRNVKGIKHSSKIQQPHFIFIEPPSLEVLEQRLRNRESGAKGSGGSQEDEEAEAVLQERIEEAKAMMAYGRPEYEQFESSIVNDDLDEAYARMVAVLKKWYLLPTAPATISPRSSPRLAISEVKSTPRSASGGQGRIHSSMSVEFEEMAQLREELWSVNDTVEVLMAEAAESSAREQEAGHQRDEARENEGRVHEQAVATEQALEAARRQMSAAVAQAQRSEARLEVVTAEREEALRRCIAAGSSMKELEEAKQMAELRGQQALAKVELVTAEREEALRRCVAAEANMSIDRVEQHARLEEENRRLLARVEVVTEEREEALQRLALGSSIQHRQETAQEPPQWDQLDQLEQADAEEGGVHGMAQEQQQAQARRARLDTNLEAERMEAVLQGAAEQARAEAAEQALSRAREQLAQQAAKYEKELEISRTAQQLLTEGATHAAISAASGSHDGRGEAMAMSAQLLGQAQSQEFEASLEVVSAERDEALRRCEEALRRCAESERGNKVLEKAMVEGQRQMYAEARRGEQLRKSCAAQVDAAKQEAKFAEEKARREAAAAMHETQASAELRQAVMGQKAEEEVRQVKAEQRATEDAIGLKAEEEVRQVKAELRAAKEELEDGARARLKIEEEVGVLRRGLAEASAAQEEVDGLRAEVERITQEAVQNNQEASAELGEVREQLGKRMQESLTGPEIELAVSPMIGSLKQAVELAENSAAKAVNAKQSELDAVSGELEHVKSTSLGQAELGELHRAMVALLEEHEGLKQHSQAMGTELLRSQQEVARLAVYEHPHGGYEEERRRAVAQATMEAKVGARSEREEALRLREEEVLTAAEGWVTKGEAAVATLKTQLTEATAREVAAADDRVKAIEELRAVRMKLVATEEARTVAVVAWREAEARAEREQAALRGEAVGRITRMQDGFDAQLHEHVSVAVRQVEEQKLRALEDQRALAKQVHHKTHGRLVMPLAKCGLLMLTTLLFLFSCVSCVGCLGFIVNGSTVSQEGRDHLPACASAGTIAARV
jgi:guanylate kinase